VELLLCHDSGPMHLAAAVDTRCVAVFSKKDPPGKWYPFGVDHIILRPPKTADSIRAIRPSEVSAAVNRALAGRPRSASEEAKPKGRISAA
jgi:ADP-heptose:LPS heptosyltransferase